MEYLIKDRIKGPARYPKRPTKIAITLVNFGPTHGWACLGIAKLKQIVNEKPKRNPENPTSFPPYLLQGQGPDLGHSFWFGTIGRFYDETVETVHICTGSLHSVSTGTMYCTSTVPAVLVPGTGTVLVPSMICFVIPVDRGTGRWIR
jgi:hypothetical protein